MYAHAQGCSDAGVCTIGHMRPSQQRDTASAGSVILFAGAGLGEKNSVVMQAGVELNLRADSASVFQIRIPYSAIRGNIGRTHGLSDISLSLSKRIPSSSSTVISWVLGTRIPTGLANRRDEDGKPLPMAYQTSLGTLDVITGVNMDYGGWRVAWALQLPVWNLNDNQFLAENYPSTDLRSEYFNGKGLRRGPDLMVRSEWTTVSGKWVLNPGALLIYRLGGDRLLDKDGKRHTPKGSEGLSVNAALNSRWQAGKKTALLFQLGVPLLVRSYRADGLTRSALASVSLQHFF